jgi:hypothetical protein
MANRSNVWAAMYGEDEEIDGRTQQTSKKVRSWFWHQQKLGGKTLTTPRPIQMVANNRRFLSAQPPFATDDDSVSTL